MTDIVERLNYWASCTQPGGEPRELLRAAIAEITKLRSQLSLQKEKLPSATGNSSGLNCPTVSRLLPNGTVWNADWRDYPEAP